MIDWDAILKGGAVAVIIGLPLTIVANVIHDDHPDSVWLVPLFFGVLVGFVLAGFVSGRTAARYPYTNGAIGAFAGFLVMAAISVVVRATGDDSLQIGKLVGTGLLAYGCGLTGAVAGARRTPA